MNRVKTALGQMCHAGCIASAVLVLSPVTALAEGEVGPDILIPKPTEFLPALIAFLIIWFVLAKFAWPQILGVLEKREAKIRGDIEAAEQERKAAEEKYQECENELLDARRRADEIVSQARRDGEQERSRIVAKAQNDATAIVTKAHDALASERRRAEIELSDSVIDLSVEIAGKIIGNDLSESEQRKLAEHYLAEVDGPDDKQA